LLARIEQAGVERVGIKHIRMIEAIKGTLAEEVVG
jgi:hypothetical protein